MGEEVRLLAETGENPLVRQRIGLTIKCGYLVACLNGLEVDLETVLGQDMPCLSQVKEFIRWAEGKSR